MSSTPSPTPSRPSTPSLPLPLSASIILTHLPKDSSTALASADVFPTAKVTVRFKAIGSAPILNKQICKIGSNARFEVVSGYLRRVLRLEQGDSVCCYVNSSFAPAGDEVVGNLHRVSDTVKGGFFLAFAIRADDIGVLSQSSR